MSIQFLAVASFEYEERGQSKLRKPVVRLLGLPRRTRMATKGEAARSVRTPARPVALRQANLARPLRRVKVMS